MKKHFWIGILFMMLTIGMVGCGGTSSPAETSMELTTESTVAITEDNAPAIHEEHKDINVLFDTVEDCVTILRICVNPEMEMYLDVHGLVVQVKAANSDAEEILEGIDCSSASYEVGVQMILLSLYDHGYCGADQGMEITMYSKEEAVESEVILQNLEAAIAQIEQDLNIAFSCDVKSASGMTGSQENLIDDTEEEDVQETLTQAEAENLPETEEETLSSYTEVEHDRDGNVIKIFYYEIINGRPLCVRESGQNEGRSYDLWYHYDEDGTFLWEELVHEDGSRNETYYENGMITYSNGTEADGVYWENFYENGVRVRVEETDTAKGIYATYLCDADGDINYGSGQRGALYFEATYFKNGTWATWTSYHSTGEKTVEYYNEAGDLLKIDCYDKNGNYVETKQP